LRESRAIKLTFYLRWQQKAREPD